MSGVLVEVVVEDGREISWGSNIAERLDERLADIRQAIQSSADVVATSLPALAAAHGWSLTEVSASFGITLTAEAGVLVSKASAAATFDVVITYTRTQHDVPAPQ